MKKIGTLLIIATLFVLSYTNTSFSQLGMGEWRMHVSPNSAIDIVEGKEAVYAILEKGMLEYDLAAGEQTVWTVADYLSDVSPTALAYHKSSDNLLIGYENGNLDLIHDNAVYNLPAIVQSTVNGVKKINNIVVRNDYAYLATGVGIVVVNIKEREILDTYHPAATNKEFIDITFWNDNIYALTAAEVYVSNKNNSFLADPGQWELMPHVNDYTETGGYGELEVFNNQLYLSYNHEFYNGDTLFQVVNGIPTMIMDEVEINGIDAYDAYFLVSFAGSVQEFNSSLEEVGKIFQYSGAGFPDPVHACKIGSTYFIADQKWGVIKAESSYNSDLIKFEGPRYNSAYRTEWRNGTLAVANGSLNGTAPAFKRDGGSVMEDEKWISTVITEDPMLKNTEGWDFISTAINPKNTDEVAYGTYSGIPLIITKNGAVTDTFVFSNSLIEETGTVGWGFITDIIYDTDGNLWVANANAVRPLKVRAESGVWHDFNLGGSVNNRITKRLIIDQNDVKWLAVGGAGIVAFDEGDDIDDTSDDRYRLLSTGEANGNLPSAEVEAMAEDLEGNIWIGTPEGMRVLYNAGNVFDADPGQYNFQKLLIEYGENVEIVLGTTHITSIEIDGANRKWIGTAGGGVFLLSPDGLEVERNFTAENSPLLHNTVMDISINETTGEVFFVTEDGMISYRSDASKGDREYENVKVFPNPVHPDYFGPITIQGIAYNSDVKITDVSGKLIYKTISNGGTATWSGKTLDGERAATGVYLIWTSIDNEEIKGRQVGKVVLIN